MYQHRKIESLIRGGVKDRIERDQKESPDQRRDRVFSHESGALVQRVPKMEACEPRKWDITPGERDDRLSGNSGAR